MGDLPVVCDNGALCHMSHIPTGMLNCRTTEDTRAMRIASGNIYSIQGYNDLPLTFRSSSDEVTLLLRDVAHVPSLSYHLFSLRVAISGIRTPEIKPVLVA